MKKPVTLEVHPGNTQCRLYLWPTHMRPNQYPCDLWPNYGHLAKEVGILDSNLQIVCLDQALRPWAHEIEGTLPLTILEGHLPEEDCNRIFGESA
jgi:hypothetical protein